MHRKGRSLPLVFLLSISAVFLYSYSRLHHFSTPSSSPTPLSRFPSPTDPFPATFSFTIKLLAFDRIDSLRRCLRSLSTADYGGDRVALHVYVDHFRAVNGSADLVEAKLEEAKQLLEFVDGFRWEHGEKLVHYRTANVGLQAQWLEAWWPGSDDEFAFVVEDDLEVSALYYKFLKSLIAKYYYDSSNFSPSIYGASLQRPRFVPGKHGNKLQLDSETHLFLYQLVGTWGQLLFPKPWKEFRLSYDNHKSKGIKPILQGMVTTGWYKRMGEKIWTPWFIKFIHSHRYYNIYTNFQHERALSISHRDAGVNYGKSAGPDSVLLDKQSLDFDLWKLQPLGNLKWYDFCFREVLPGKIIRNFDELGHVLNSLQNQKTIIAFSLDRVAENIARNLFCHLERLNIRNYILINANSMSLLDLARRGHHVIDSDALLTTIPGYKQSGRPQSEVDLVKEILIKAYVIKKSLKQGYSTWMVDANVLPVSNVFVESSFTSNDVFAPKYSDVMLIRSSPASLKFWDDKLISELAAAGNSLAHKSNLADFVADALERSGVRISRDDALDFGVRLGVSAVNTSMGDVKKIVFWHPNMELDSVQRELENSGLWSIDGESSCTAVVCHQT